MGYGDDIIATGLARGLAARQRLAAFGDGKRIIWGPWSEEIFRHNPNIAKPDQSGQPNVEWIAHYKGSRLYNRSVGGRWEWNYKFKVSPGEFYFDEREAAIAREYNMPFVVIEPNVPWQKRVASNKDWGEQNYNQLSEILQRKGHRIVQFIHGNSRRKLRGATFIETNHFRDAIAILSKANLYIGPEGGLHHAAAAVGIRAVVLLGGFIPAQVVGYPTHFNLTGDSEACGNIEPCIHCLNAMKRITAEEVIAHAKFCLEERVDDRKHA